MKKWFISIVHILGFFLFTSTVQANDVYQITNSQHRYISHHFANNTLVLTTSLGQLTMTALHNNAISIVFDPQDSDVPATHLPSFAIQEGHQNTSLELQNLPDKLILSAGKLTAKIHKKSFNISYFRGNEWLISERGGFFTGVTKSAETDQHSSVKTPMHGIRFKVAEDEQFIGAGERVLGMNRRGYRLPLYNKAHYGYETYSEQMNFSLPALMSNKKYMVLFDNTAKGWLDIAKTESNIIQFEAVAGRNAYVIIAGQSYSQLIQNYVDVTGKQPMPPRWALGNFASRFGYRNQAEVMATVEKFKALDVPLDAVVIDLFWFGKNIKGHMGNLAWDKQAFPTPDKLITDLKKRGVKTILITEPFVLSSSERWQEVVTKLVLVKDAQG